MNKSIQASTALCVNKYWGTSSYTLVRFGAMIGFGLLCYMAHEDRKQPLAIAYGCLTLMFQPFLKLTLGRDVWHMVDVGVAMFLIVILLRNREV